MLGSDKYTIISNMQINNADLTVLLKAYRPIMGETAMLLYLTLLIDNQKEKDINYILNLLNISIDSFETSLADLNCLALVDTFQKDKHYFLAVHAPLSLNNFLKHDIYARLLRKKIGSLAFNELKSSIKEYNLADYHNISAKFDLNILDGWNQEMEKDIIAKNIKEEENINSLFPIEHFLSDCDDYLFPYIERTKENLKEICCLADLYGIDENEMRIYLSRSFKGEKLSLELLRRYCKNAKPKYKKIADGDYAVAGAIFLMNKQNGKEVTPYDRRLLDDLAHKYYLNVEVINVLIEYALKICDNHLYPNFVLPIAADLHRNNVDTAKKALAILNNPNKKTEKTKQAEIKPVYDTSNNPKVDQALIDALYEDDDWRK